MKKSDLVKKIVKDKLIYKTENRDFEELSEEIFGEGNCFSSSEVRKRMYGMRYLMELEEQEKLDDIEDNEILKKIEEKRLELEKERKKLQATKIEYNRNLRYDSRQELLYENIKETQERLPLPSFKDVAISKENGSYVLCFADLHYGANFISENNIYNREECRKRMEQLASEVKEMCIDKNISKLSIIGLSDDLQGILRISDVKINDIPVVECVVEVSRLIGQFLNSISEVTIVEYYHVMNSNHTQTRPLNSKHLLSQEDLEIIIGNYIKDLLKSNWRVEVNLSNKDYQSLTIEGQNILALHGHQVKNVKSIIKDYSIQHKKFYDLVFMGHLHGGQSITLGEINGNSELHIIPSIVGSDPYSDSLQLGSKSMAKMFKIKENKGITEEYTFILN